MLAILLIAGLLFCQTTKPRCSPEDYKNLYEVENVELPYEGEFETIRDVDFKNLSVTVFSYGSVFFRAKLTHGKYERHGKSGNQAVDLLSVHYFEARGNEPARAIVKLELSTGAASTCYSVILQVFELRGKRLFLIQNIRFGERDPSDTQLDWKRKTLDILAIHPCDDNAWCCRLQVRFRWNGKRFQTVSVKEIPTQTKSCRDL